MANFTKLAERIAEKLKSKQVVGVGTGSTVAAVIPELAKKVKDTELDVLFVSTSQQTTDQLTDLELKVLDINSVKRIDWGFDGADAVNQKRQLIKGKGAAMLREKIMASLCREYYVIIDDSKLCNDIALKAAVPVEFIPEAAEVVKQGLSALKTAQVELRMAVKKHGPVITEKGNLIYDVTFTEINEKTEGQIKQIVGVVESGLFYQYADQILIAKDSGLEII